MTPPFSVELYPKCVRALRKTSVVLSKDAPNSGEFGYGMQLLSGVFIPNDAKVLCLFRGDGVEIAVVI
jgi:hypothetical protein